MSSYEGIRQRYRPAQINILLIAESPPPADPAKNSSRHFYQDDYQKLDDRLFANTMRAIYPEAAAADPHDLEAAKPQWLERFRGDGFYMIEALEESQPHQVTKPERQERLRQVLPRLTERVKQLANSDTKLILIKSNVFEVTAEPLRAAGFTVLNTALLDYPGRFNQRAYREKLAALLGAD